MKLLNIGCGANYHPAWTNIDMVSTSPHVIAHDIRRGLPFADETFDAVYHSHVIEHLTPYHASLFLRECARVCKPGGTVRIATPDLEAMTRAYLDRLGAALGGDSRAAADHHWMELELFDQMVRNSPGGEMGRYLQKADPSDRAFILSRIGKEAEQFWAPRDLASSGPLRMTGILKKIIRLAVRAWHGLIAFLIGILAGRRAKDAFRQGLFRSSGEIHQWLYDRYSLARLMEEAKLVDIRPCSAQESRIADFASYGLDIAEGTVRKPDSLFMEGSKPR